MTTAEIAQYVRPQSGHTVRFRDLEGHSRRGEIMDVSASAWDGNITYLIADARGRQFSVQAARVEYVTR